MPVIMTDEEIAALRQQVVANPHLLAARELLRSDPEIAVQTIANELGQHIADDAVAFKEHLERVAHALGYKVTWNETDKSRPKTHIDAADKHGHFPVPKLKGNPADGQVIEAAGSATGEASGGA